MLTAVLFPVNARTFQPTEINNDLCVAAHNAMNSVAIAENGTVMSAFTSAPERRPK